LQTLEKEEIFLVQTGGSALNLDFDGDDRVLPQTDVLMLMRQQLGLRGDAVVDGAVSDNAAITSASTIAPRVAQAAAQVVVGGIGEPFRFRLDFDRDGRVNAHTDLLMLSRFLLGARGSALVAGVVGEDATARSPLSIETSIREALMQPLQ
jgi:hypothetical protein